MTKKRAVSHSTDLRVKPYYDHGGITIYHGDCRELLATLSVHVVITDPPYSAETHKGARTRNDDDPGLLIDFAPMPLEELTEIFGALRVARWCVATTDYRHIGAWAINPPNGLRFVRFGVWIKPNGAPQFSGDRPSMGWEGVAIMHNVQNPLHWNGGGQRAVWTVSNAIAAHPAGKPPELVNRFVSLFSDQGETILDPFMGAGTTLVAAKNFGREAIGIEIEERYCEMAARRLSQETLDLGGAA